MGLLLKTEYTIVCDHCQHEEYVGDGSEYNKRIDSCDWLSGTIHISTNAETHHPRGVTFCSLYCFARFMDAAKKAVLVEATRAGVREYRKAPDY